MIEFHCKNCGQKLSVQDQHSGKRVKCPKCGSVGVVPDNSDKIKFNCENCGQSIRVPQIHAGKKGKCPKCKNVVVIPIREATPSKSPSMVSFTCSMCDETIQVPETSIGKTIECPGCGSYIETSPGDEQGEPDVSADEDLYEERDEEYEESEGVDKRIIVGISAVAAIVVVGLIILITVILPSGSRPVEKPLIVTPESNVKPDREPEKPGMVAEEPVEAAPLPKLGDVVTNSIGMKLVYIPAGSFMMGSSESVEKLLNDYGKSGLSKSRIEDEFPQHEVRISKGLWMGQTEVTQRQYKSVMNAQPWLGQDSVQDSAENPAVYVSWEDATAFCAKLSRQTSETYRLATEAEWEYACRAGTTTRFNVDDIYTSLDDSAWIIGEVSRMDEKYAHPVGEKKPNPWGLYDMHGNVLEWCSDWYDTDYYSNSPSVDPKGPSDGRRRSLRGGSWINSVYNLRCSSRGGILPGRRFSYVGFRVVCSQLIPPPGSHVEPDQVIPRQDVGETGLRPRPVASDTQPTEPVVKELSKEAALPEEPVSSRDKLYRQTEIMTAKPNGQPAKVVPKKKPTDSVITLPSARLSKTDQEQLQSLGQPGSKPPDESPTTQSAVIPEDKELADMLKKGSIVSIHASKQTVGSVLTQIEKATGNQVRIADNEFGFGRDDERTLSKRISINLQEKPFWEAIDAVSAAVGIKCCFIKDGMLRLSTQESRFNKIKVIGTSTVIGAFQLYPGFDNFFNQAIIVIRPEPRIGKPQLRGYQAEITLPGGEQIRYKPDSMFDTSNIQTGELTLRIDRHDLNLPNGVKKAQEVKIEARLAVASDFKAFTLPPLGELVPKPVRVGNGIIYVKKAESDRSMFAVNLLAEGLTFELRDIVLVDEAGNRVKSFGGGGSKQENRQNVSLNFPRAKISGNSGKCQLVFDVPGRGEKTIGPLEDIIPKSTSTGASVIRITGANMTEQSNVGENGDFEVRVEFDGFPGSRDGVALVGTAGRPLVSNGWGGADNMWQFWFDAAQIRGQPESYRLRFQAPTKVTEHVLRATFDNVPLMKEE